MSLSSFYKSSPQSFTIKSNTAPKGPVSPSYTPAPIKPKPTPITSSTRFRYVSGGSGSVGTSRSSSSGRISGTIAPGAGIPKDSVIDRVKTQIGEPIKREEPTQKIDVQLISSRPTGTTGRTLPSNLSGFVSDGKLDVKGALASVKESELTSGKKSIGGASQVRGKEDFDTQIKGVGAQNISDKTARESLKIQGVDLSKQGGSVAQQTIIENERRRLQSIAATPQQRERLTALGAVELGVATLPYSAAAGAAGFTGALVSGLAQATGAVAVSVPVAKGTSDVFNPSPLTEQQRRTLTQRVDKSVSARVTKEGLDLPFVGQEIEQFTGGLVGDITYGIYGGKLGAQSKSAEEYKKVLKEMGFEGKELERIAAAEFQREVVAGSLGEIAGFAAAAGTVGEIAGAASQKGLNVLTKAGTKTLSPLQATVYGAGSGALGGAIGGALEVAVADPFYYAGRYKTLTPEQYAQDVAFGSLTAGIGGGIIGGLVTRKTSQKVVYGAASTLEFGQEYLGDVGAKKLVGEVFESGLSIKGMGKVKLPTVTTTVTPIINPSVTQTVAPSVTPSVTKSLTPTDVFIPTTTPTVSPQLTVIQTPTPTPSPSVTPVFSITETPTQTPITTPTESITETPTETITQTLTPTQTITPTITSTAFAPFLPLGGPGLGIGSGSRNLRRKARTRYFDELASAKSLLKDFKPIPFNPPKQSSPRKTKTKKKTKKTGVVYPRVNTPQISFTNVFSTKKSKKNKKGFLYDFGV